jgi:hypothetical protein
MHVGNITFFLNTCGGSVRTLSVAISLLDPTDLIDAKMCRTDLWDRPEYSPSLMYCQ